MSYKNFKLNKWIHPVSGEVRYYVGTSYCERRGNCLYYANGTWLHNVDGKAVFGYKLMYHGATERALGMMNVADLLDNAQRGLNRHDFKYCLEISFEELERRYELCQTKSGNFSYVKYEKQFDKVLA